MKNLTWKRVEEKNEEETKQILEFKKIFKNEKTHNFQLSNIRN